MAKTILILFGLLTAIALYSTYAGIGLQGVSSEQHSKTTSVRSYHTGYGGYSSGGWSMGK